MEKEHVAICGSTSSNESACSWQPWHYYDDQGDFCEWLQARFENSDAEEAFDTIVLAISWWCCQGEYHYTHREKQSSRKCVNVQIRAYNAARLKGVRPRGKFK
jgi:hypothetical protein